MRCSNCNKLLYVSEKAKKDGVVHCSRCGADTLFTAPEPLEESVVGGAEAPETDPKLGEQLSFWSPARGDTSWILSPRMEIKY